MANDYNGYIASYREYQRGDHYRKALTAWGPHSADYMATRLVTLGRRLKAPGEPLPTDQTQEAVEDPRIAADNVFNDARAEAFGTTGAGLIAAYEAALPDDGGEAEAVTQPADVERFDAAFFTWNGGSNFTDNPDVRVQREVDGAWQDYADSSGEVPITLEFPQGPDVPSYETGSFEWKWTAHFEAFVSRFDLGDRPRATPPGSYRFVVDGLRREGGAAVPYTVTSREFLVAPWSGVTVEDIRVEPDGRVSFAVGPRTTQQVTGGGGPDLTDEIGPIDYPDSYESPARFIDDTRTFLRDPAAPGDPREARVVLRGRARGGPGSTRATPRPSSSPWSTAPRARRWPPCATVTAGSAPGRWPRESRPTWPRAAPATAYGNYNGAPSAVVGAAGVAATGECAPPAPPGGGSGPGPGRRPDPARAAEAPGGDGTTEPGCVRATGRLRGRRLGRVALGRTRARNRRAFPSHARVAPHHGPLLLLRRPPPADRLPVPRAAAARSPARERRRVRGRAIFAVHLELALLGAAASATDPPAPRSARRGGRCATAWGSTTGTCAAGARATVLFKVRDGTVREVGLADRRLTGGRAEATRFLRSFE